MAQKIIASRERMAVGHKAVLHATAFDTRGEIIALASHEVTVRWGDETDSIELTYGYRNFTFEDGRWALSIVPQA